MSPAELTFACELDPARLGSLFADGSVCADLVALRARVTLMISDLSAERALVVQQLNTAGVPVVAVPLVSLDDGYYFTPDNVPRAIAAYERWQAWTIEHELRWSGVGLDIEPDAAIYLQLMRRPLGVVPMLAPRLFDRRRPEQAKRSYDALVERIHRDGWPVENYQFPPIVDERRAGSTLLQRLLGLVDVSTDREVWMLYTSFARSIGPGLLWCYGREATAIAVGTTGGGPDIPGHPQMPALSWTEFARDLRLAAAHTSIVYVHSLEGCVWQGFLTQLRSFDWTAATTAPAGARRARAARAVLTTFLRLDRHAVQITAAITTAALARWIARNRRVRNPSSSGGGG